MYRSALHYGWKPDLPDKRDLTYSALEEKLPQLPPAMDLRSKCPPVYDQGQLGSCTANAIAGAFQFELIRQNAPSFVPSRLFIYYNERSIENTIKTDSGAQTRDGLKSIGNIGVCPETMWPYRVSEFAVKPFQICYTDALQHKTIDYKRIPRSLEQMKSCLAAGFPFMMGFTVYTSFESAAVGKTGILNMPSLSEKNLGGHAVLVVGYDDGSKRFIVRNSWGPDWGMQGYFTMPYEYLTNEHLSDDFWTIRQTTSNPELRRPAIRSAQQPMRLSLNTPLSATQGSEPIPCITPGCGYHVYPDPDAKPIPALVATSKKISEEMHGPTTMYLTCDNPTPHTNRYTINLK